MLNSGNLKLKHNDEYYQEKQFLQFLPNNSTKKNIQMSGVEHITRVRKLYKLIFRVHRALPPELRIMGDNYAREEFKRHKTCNPEETRIFLNEWADYAINLARQMKPLQQVKKKTIGKYMDPKLLDHMTDEQIVQLYELHKAATQPSINESGNTEERK